MLLEGLKATELGRLGKENLATPCPKLLLLSTQECATAFDYES